MDKVNDGGPAFPIPLAPGELYTETGSGCGMTLRDYFAAKAMQAILPNWAGLAEHHDEAFGKDVAGCMYRVAVSAYEVADAMIKRAKQKS
jgi:hypothetical protein